MSYIEREAAIKHLKRECVAKYPNTFSVGLTAAANEISKMPTADLVEVVRCKDCKRCKKFKRIDGTYFFSCRNGCFKEVVSADHFCSYGERRAENEG